MRLVAGKYKGHRIDPPRRAATRPTQDRVREALFSILGDVSGLSVLDLYAGSGALGLEAISRGAVRADLVDSDRSAQRAIRQNIERLGVDEAAVFPADALAFLRAAARRSETWDLVFCDPPYRLAHRHANELGRLLVPVLAPRARIVCESSQRQPLKLELPVLTERRYGDTLIVIHDTGDLDAA